VAAQGGAASDGPASDGAPRPELDARLDEELRNLDE
jgi:hypothetical protein